MVDNLSRRTVLAAAGAAAIALALSEAAPGAASAAAATGRRQLLGATVDLAAKTYDSCPGGLLNLCTARYFDKYLSTGLSTPIPMAVKLQKVYLVEGQLPATPPPAYKAFCAQGGELLISMKPAQKTSTKEDQEFQACVRGFVEAGLAFRIVLWQECNGGGFPSATAYQDYWAHYHQLVRAVRADIPVVYDPALALPSHKANAESVVSYFPAAGPLPDYYYTDYYGTAYDAGSRLDGTDHTGADIQGQADQYGIPLGQGEFGARGAVPSYTFNKTYWDAYITYLISLYTARLQAGKTNGWIIYFGFNGHEEGLGNNGLTGPSDPKIPMLQKLYAALAPAGESPS
jgi:hypothetical protein